MSCLGTGSIAVSYTHLDVYKRQADKVTKVITTPSWLMANISVPRFSKRRLLMTAAQSVLYPAVVQGRFFVKRVCRKRFEQLQRRAALRVASAYRTVS